MVEHGLVVVRLADGFGAGQQNIGSGGVNLASGVQGHLGAVVVEQLGFRRIYGHAPIVQLVVLHLEGDVVPVRPGEDEVVAILLVHGLNNGLGYLVQSLHQLGAGVAGGVVEQLLGHALQGVQRLAIVGVNELVNGIQAAPGGGKLFVGVVADFALTFHGHAGLAQPERLGGGGGILGVGVERALSEHGFSGSVLGDEGIHQIGAVASQHSAGSSANHVIKTPLHQRPAMPVLLIRRSIASSMAVISRQAAE